MLLKPSCLIQWLRDRTISEEDPQVHAKALGMKMLRTEQG